MSHPEPSYLPRFAAAIADYREHRDALRLVGEVYALMRPRHADDTETAARRHLALIELLESDPQACRELRTAYGELLSTRALVGFFADSGILPPTGFFSELLRIVSHRLLPEIPDPREFRDCLRIVLDRSDDWVWLAAIPLENSVRLWRLLVIDDELGRLERRRIADQVIEAMLVLAYRISGLDVQQEFLRLGDGLAAQSAAFRAVAGEAQRYADALVAALDTGMPPQEDERHLLVLVDQCRTQLARAHRAASRVGTSLTLTHLLRRTGQYLARLELVARLLGESSRLGHDGDAVALWAQLLRQTVRAENERDSLRRHVARGVALLALRVTDNAAKSGEHYLTETRASYFAMWRSAAGAGLIIAVLALLKIFASQLELPPAGYAFTYSMIYGLGFALIYVLHLTIATKQPAMTAQTLAGRLGEMARGSAEEIERLVDLIAAVARSQLAAIVGNVAVALPTAILVGVLWRSVCGEAMLDPGKGAHLLADLDPLGWALPHAAIAGVFLFLSGILSGYFDNRAAYARIGERVAALRWLRAVAGATGAGRCGAYVDAHLGGLAGNFLFGCMLGSAGTLGVILGLPIDIRHIAFSSANLGYALTAFDFALPPIAVVWAALGVLLIGLVNLAVSFALALWMALRARDIAFAQTGALMRVLWQRLREAPGSFIAAPAATPPTGRPADSPPGT